MVMMMTMTMKMTKMTMRLSSNEIPNDTQLLVVRLLDNATTYLLVI
jgi:hypothetical protein